MRKNSPVRKAFLAVERLEDRSLPAVSISNPIGLGEPPGQPHHHQWLELDSFSWGAVNPGRLGRHESSAVSAQDFNLAMTTGTASPKLMQACAMGDPIKELKLSLVKASSGEKPVDYLTWKMSDAFISSYQIGGSSGVPTDSFSLNFKSIKVVYKEQGNSGNVETRAVDAYFAQDDHSSCDKPPRFECGQHYLWWLQNHDHKPSPPKPPAPDDHSNCDKPPRFECGQHYLWWLQNHDHKPAKDQKQGSAGPKGMLHLDSFALDAAFNPGATGPATGLVPFDSFHISPKPYLVISSAAYQIQIGGSSGVPTPGATGLATGLVPFDSFRITPKPYPLFVDPCVANKHVPLTLQPASAAGDSKPAPYLTWQFSDAFITSAAYQIGGSSGVPTDSFSLNFTTIGVGYQQQQDPATQYPLRRAMTGSETAANLRAWTIGELLDTLMDLQARKDEDWRQNGGRPGPNDRWLWQQIKKVMAELDARGVVKFDPTLRWYYLEGSFFSSGTGPYSY